MPQKIYIRRGTKTELDEIVLNQGEPGWTVDTKEFYIGDGVTSGGVFIAGSGTGISSLNSLIGSVTVSGGTGISVIVSGQYIIIDEEAGGLDVDSINGLAGIVTLIGGQGIDVTVSGQSIVIDEEAGGLDVDKLNELTGEVTLVGGQGIDVTVSGQSIVIDEEAGGLDVDSINGLSGEVTISGNGGIDVTEDGQIIVISGADNVSSINELIEEVTISGQGTVTVSEDGQIITISGSGGSGDMTKAVYDTDEDSIVDKAESVDDGTYSASAQEISDAVDQMHSNVIGIPFLIDGGGVAVTSGEKGHVRIPFDCTIIRATLLADQSGSVIIDIWKDTYDNFPPTDSGSITASTPPTVTSEWKSEDDTLSGWITTVSADDVLAFHVDSCSGIQRVTLNLKVTKD